MNYFKILDQIELKLKNKDFNPAMDRVIKGKRVFTAVLHPFSGEVFQTEPYTEDQKIDHRKRLIQLWEKIRDYAYFECKYQITQ